MSLAHPLYHFLALHLSQKTVVLGFPAPKVLDVEHVHLLTTMLLLSSVL